MGENIKQQAGKVQTFVKGLSKKTIFAILVLVALGIGMIIFLVVRYNSRPYVTLFSELSSDDMSAILQYMDESGATDYRVRNNDTILVPSGQQYKIAANVLKQGLPKSNFNYGTYLDNIGSLSTSQQQAQLSKFEVQDRLGATIAELDNVRSAVVNINLEQDSRYVLSTEDFNRATASVTVTTREDHELTKSEVSIIRKIVAHSVSGLDPEDVTVNDTAGNDYDGDGSIDPSDSSSLKRKAENQMNTTVRNSVMNVLVPIYGKNNVEVSARSTFNVTKIYEDRTEYTDPPGWPNDGSTNGRGLREREIWGDSYNTNADVVNGGVVGTTTNAEIPEYETNETEMLDNANGFERHGEIDYVVNQYHIQNEDYSATLADLSVAVVINSNVGEVYVDELIPLVARAAGIDVLNQAQKVSVFAQPFYDAGEEIDPNATEEGVNIPTWLIVVLVIGLVIFFILLAIIMVVQKNRQQRRAKLMEEYLARKKLEEEAAAEKAAERAAEEAALLAARAAEGNYAPGEEPEGANIMELHTERSMALRQEVRQFVEENPELAAQMIKTWLREGGDENG